MDSPTQDYADGTPLALVLNLSHESGDLDLGLVSPDGSFVVSDTLTDQERIELVAGPGEYRARVYGFWGAIGDYTLGLALGTPAP